MAFQTGTSTSIENLLTQLSTLLQANGWTQGFFNSGDPGTIGFNKNQNFGSFQFSETAAGGGVMVCYQARAADPAPTTDPWTATGDSGAGEAGNATGNFQGSLSGNSFAGPHTNFWFFEQDANPAYCHVVVEVDAGRYRHFGFGQIDKVGDWVGGEYTYGLFLFLGGQASDPKSVFNEVGMDSFQSQRATTDAGATIRIEGLAGEPSAATIWGRFGIAQGGNDRAGNPRYQIAGGWRWSREFFNTFWIRVSEATAFKPLAPISIRARNEAAAPDAERLMGYQADVRFVNGANINPAQIINIGGDDWYFFPVVAKSNLGGSVEESENWFVAYRRENA